VEDPHRFIDVLEVLFAAIGEADCGFALDLVMGCTRQADAAWLSGSLQTGAQIDAVAVDLAPILNHVTQIDADADGDPLIGCDIDITVGQRSLDCGSGIDRQHHAGEGRQHGITGITQHCAAGLADLCSDVIKHGHDTAMGTNLVGTRQPAVTGDIGVKHRGQSAGHAHAPSSRKAGAVPHCTLARIIQPTTPCAMAFRRPSASCTIG